MHVFRQDDDVRASEAIASINGFGMIFARVRWLTFQEMILTLQGSARPKVVKY